MDNEDYGYEYNEGSDIDNWEIEQVFQDHEGQEDEEPEEDRGGQGEWGMREDPREDFGYFGEMGMMED